jgi:CBS domain containing-hemolysin-like protein
MESDIVSGTEHIGLMLALFAVPVLVFINGFFVAAEFALVSVRKTRIEDGERWHSWRIESPKNYRKP